MLTKYDQLDVAVSDSLTMELPSDVAMLLNGLKNKVGGIKPFLIEEISQHSTNTTVKSDIV
jgi:hypothetical protein